MAHGATTRPRHVLLVDDFPDTVDMLADVLMSHGYYITLALNGADAIRLAREQRPDLIIMDLAMPRMNGLEATRKLKADEATRDIPVLLYTAHAGGEVELAARLAGCTAVIPKPVELNALVGMVEATLTATAAAR